MIIEELDALKATTELLMNLWLGSVILFLFSTVVFIIKYTQLYDWCETLEQKIKLWAPENLDDLPQYNDYVYYNCPEYIPKPTSSEYKESIRSIC